MKKIILIGTLLLCAQAVFAQAHKAIWATTATSCTTTTPCTLNIWRVALPGNSNCPATGNSAYINVTTTPTAPNGLVPDPNNVTPSGTHWDYTDTGASLVNGSTYCGYSTVTSGGVVSAPSAIFQQAFKATLDPPTNVVTTN